MHTDATSQRLTRLEQELREERQRSAYLEQQLAQAQAEAQNAIQQHQQYPEEYNYQQQQQQQQLQQQQQQYQQLYASFEQIDLEKRAYEARVTALEDENADLNSRCVMNSQQIRTQAMQLNDKAAVISQLEQEVESLQAGVYETSASIHEDMVEEANVTIYKWQESYQQLQQDYCTNYTRVMEEKDQLQSDLKQWQARVEESENQLEKLTLHKVPVKVEAAQQAQEVQEEKNKTPASQNLRVERHQGAGASPIREMPSPGFAARSADSAPSAVPAMVIPPIMNRDETHHAVEQPIMEMGGGGEQTGLRQRHIQQNGNALNSASSSTHTPRNGTGNSGNTDSTGSTVRRGSKMTQLPPTTRTSYCRLCYLLLLALTKMAILVFLVLYIFVTLDLDRLILKSRDAVDGDGGGGGGGGSVLFFLAPALLPAMYHMRGVHTAAQGISGIAELFAMLSRSAAQIGALASVEDFYASLSRIPQKVLDAVLSMER